MIQDFRLRVLGSGFGAEARSFGIGVELRVVAWFRVCLVQGMCVNSVSWNPRPYGRGRPSGFPGREWWFKTLALAETRTETPFTLNAKHETLRRVSSTKGSYTLCLRRSPPGRTTRNDRPSDLSAICTANPTAAPDTRFHEPCTLLLAMERSSV